MYGHPKFVHGKEIEINITLRMGVKYSLKRRFVSTLFLSFTLATRGRCLKCKCVFLIRKGCFIHRLLSKTLFINVLVNYLESSLISIDIHLLAAFRLWKFFIFLFFYFKVAISEKPAKVIS